LRRRVAVAGYRLAYMIESIFKTSTSTSSKRKEVPVVDLEETSESSSKRAKLNNSEGIQILNA
jgi:hypothetical protein